MLHWLNAAPLLAQLITVSCCHVRTTSDGRKTGRWVQDAIEPVKLHTGSRTETMDGYFFTIYGPVSVAQDTQKSSSGSRTAALSGISGGPCSIGFAKLGLVLRGGTNGCGFKVLIPLIA
ncbi:hypothetical protein V8C34DRAFT_297275 [Trichoderma compactum]